MTKTVATMYAHILRNDFSAYMHRSFLELYPSIPYHPNWHIDAMAAVLEAVRRGEHRRLIINVMPRHLKSFAASIAFPSWVLGHDPTQQLISMTYGQDLSDDLARTCRKLMQSRFYQSLFDTRLSPDRLAIADFATTKGGYRLATSVGGALTGRGANIIIIDDPLKADDALSDTRRQAVNDHFDNTVRSRLNNQNTGAIIIVAQRLHSNDLVAHVQES